MKEPTTIAAHSQHSANVFVSPADCLVVSAGLDQTVGLWPVAPWELVRAFKRHERSDNTPSFAAGGMALASAAYEGIVRLRS